MVAVRYWTPPPLSAVRAFEAAARLSSFTKAAQELSITQGAISHGVRELELRFKVSLFVRTYPLAGHRTPLVPDQQQIDAGHAGADHRLRNQPAEPADRHPFSVA